MTARSDNMFKLKTLRKHEVRSETQCVFSAVVEKTAFIFGIKQKWSNTVKGVKMSQRDNIAEFITSASVLIRRNNQVQHIFMYLARWRPLVDVVIIDRKGGRLATLCKVHQSLCRELGGDKCG